VKIREFLFGSPTGWLLLPWAALVGFALRTGPYGLTEEGSKALLLAWSLGDQVASSVFTLGAPDVRAFVFLPLGFLWSGQVIAAKLATLLVMGGAGAALYCWRSRDEQAEAALLATGLLLIAPITVDGIDSVGAGPFLLAIVGAASWLLRMADREPGKVGGWFFTQFLLCAAAVSLHPAGLAYPAALTLHWLRCPRDRRDRQLALIGIPLVAALVLIMRMGWPGMTWGQNPLPAAAAVFGGSLPEDTWSSAAWLGAIVLIALTLAVAIHERTRLMADLTSGSLLLAVLIGGLAADRTWGLLMLALLLYGGFPWLLRACAPLASRGVLVQRGWLWVLLLLICTAFMRTNRSDFEVGRRGMLSAEDELIGDLAHGIEGSAGTGGESGQPPAILVASPWPARTSIACRCASLPLPPAAKDPESQLAMIRGLSYVVLADDRDSRALAYNFSQLGSRFEVVAKEPGGVILHLKPPAGR
jgi:hypothetical protein